MLSLPDGLPHSLTPSQEEPLSRGGPPSPFPQTPPRSSARAEKGGSSPQPVTRKSRPIEKAGSEIRKRVRDIGFSMAFLMRKLRKKSSGASIRAFFVIPSEGEEWSEWDERHGRTCREVAAREAGGGRDACLIDFAIGAIGRHDRGSL